MRLDAQPWWTAADQAELQLLTEELVDGAFNHRDGCPTCRAGDRTCQPIRDAIEVMLAWRHRRILHSQAAWLRAAQDVRDAA